MWGIFRIHSHTGIRIRSDSCMGDIRLSYTSKSDTWLYLNYDCNRLVDSLKSNTRILEGQLLIMDEKFVGTYYVLCIMYPVVLQLLAYIAVPVLNFDTKCSHRINSLVYCPCICSYSMCVKLCHEYPLSTRLILPLNTMKLLLHCPCSVEVKAGDHNEGIQQVRR